MEAAPPEGEEASAPRGLPHRGSGVLNLLTERTAIRTPSGLLRSQVCVSVCHQLSLSSLGSRVCDFFSLWPPS